MINTVSLAGKRILYIAPRFFGYDTDISSEMTRRGADVTRLFDRPFDKPMMTAVTKVAPSLIANIAFPIYRKIIENSSINFDIIFVVNGQTLSPKILDMLRAENPNASFILYLWDSLYNRPSILPAMAKYDHIFSFDQADANKFKLYYRPNFFAPVFDTECSEIPIYDINFIGTAHTDRAPVVHAIDSILPDNISRFWYLFLQAPWVRHYYNVINPSFRRVPRELFNYEPLTKSEISKIFNQSRTILDIEHPFQQGLTMRTLETLGANKKLITTNPLIGEEDFYSPNNIFIIDRKNISIDPDFFSQPYTPPPPHIREKYSLAGWLNEILKVSGIGPSNS